MVEQWYECVAETENQIVENSCGDWQIPEG